MRRKMDILWHSPGFELYEMMLNRYKGSYFYGFTKDNNKREKPEGSYKSCVEAVELLSGRDANLLVIEIPLPFLPNYISMQQES